MILTTEEQAAVDFGEGYYTILRHAVLRLVDRIEHPVNPTPYDDVVAENKRLRDLFEEIVAFADNPKNTHLMIAGHSIGCAYRARNSK